MTNIGEKRYVPLIQCSQGEAIAHGFHSETRTQQDNLQRTRALLPSKPWENSVPKFINAFSTIFKRTYLLFFPKHYLAEPVL